MQIIKNILSWLFHPLLLRWRLIRTVNREIEDMNQRQEQFDRKFKENQEIIHHGSARTRHRRKPSSA